MLLAIALQFQPLTRGQCMRMPHSICFLPEYQGQGKCFLELKLEKALRDTLTRAALSRLLSTTAN